MERFLSIGVIKNGIKFNPSKLENFVKSINKLKIEKKYNRQQLIDLFNEILPNFKHKETGRFLENRM